MTVAKRNIPVKPSAQKPVVAPVPPIVLKTPARPVPPKAAPATPAPKAQKATKPSLSAVKETPKSKTPKPEAKKEPPKAPPAPHPKAEPTPPKNTPPKNTPPKTPQKAEKAPEPQKAPIVPPTPEKPPEAPPAPPVVTETDRPPIKRFYPGQVTMKDFNEMTMTAQNELWSELQKQAPEFGFVPCVLAEHRHRTTDMVRLKDAIAQAVEAKKEPPKPFSGQLWCPYCGRYRTFRNHNGYDRCIACHMSTMDFYTRSDNHLWGANDSKSKKEVRALKKRNAVKAKEEEGDDE